MKNIEKYNDKIIDLALSGKRLGINKRTLVPCDCDGINCHNCAAFGSESSCETYRREWADAEYKEPCPFEKDEIVEVSDDGLDWRIRYFDSMSDNEEFPYIIYCYGYSSKDKFGTSLYKYCRKYGTLTGLVKEQSNEK